jgi:hypothetical protein
MMIIKKDFKDQGTSLNKKFEIFFGKEIGKEEQSDCGK